MSDERFTLTVLDYRSNVVKGRMRGFHHIYYTAEMEEARNGGKLRTNLSFGSVSFLWTSTCMENDEPCRRGGGLAQQIPSSNKRHRR